MSARQDRPVRDVVDGEFRTRYPSRPSGHRPASRLVELAVRTPLTLPPETLLSFFDADPAYEIAALLPRITLPILVTQGTADRVCPMEDAVELARALPQGRLHPFTGRCHVPIFTATTEFCEVLRQFVRGGVPPPPA